MSNVQQTNQINVNENNTNSEYYLNLMIGTQIGNIISRFNAKDGFNYKNITTLALLLSIGELKNCVKFVSKEGSAYITNNYKPFFSSLWKFTSYFPSLIYNNFFNKQIVYNNIQLAPEPNINTYEITSILEFIKGLVFYLQDPKNKSTSYYEISNTRNINIENMEQNSIYETWKNIEIFYCNTKIKLNSELTLAFEESNNFKYLKNYTHASTTPIARGLDLKYINSLKTHKRTEIYHIINDKIIGQYSFHAYGAMFKRNLSTLNLNFNDLALFEKFNIKDINTYKPLCDILEYSIYGIDFVIFLIISYHFESILSSDASICCSLYHISFLLLMVKTNLSHITSNNQINLNDIFFNNNYTILYFLDIPLTIPSFITVYIKNNKRNILGFDANFKSVYLTSYTIIFRTDNLQNELIHFGDYLKYPNTHISESINRQLRRLGYYNIDRSCKPYKLFINNSQIQFKLTSTNPNDEVNSNVGYNYLNLSRGELQIPLEQYNATVTSPVSASENTNTKINFTCETADISNDEINNIFNKFINKIKTYNIVSNNCIISNVKICKIKLNKKEENIEIENPEYKSYLEKKEILEKYCNNQSSNIQQNNTSETIIKELATIPTKTINKTIIKKEVIIDIVNNDFKSFDTMYLREDDEKKLLSVLSKFKSNKDLLKSLGLPNKLCVMLDGLPGTGKSSTILTIASYLKKDIYYLSFGDTIETNEDLQMIFDYVVKNCNGGIIVAEDIDAVGSLLHSRNSIKTIEDSNEKLSLAYVLNLLQGTITPDNLIFIATTNHIEKLDPAFYRHGRFDVRITFKLADHYQLNKIYNKFFKKNIPNNLLSKIQENKFTPAQFIFTIKNFLSEEHSDEIILQDFLDK